MWSVVAVLDVDAAGQRQVVAAATAAPAVTTALPNITTEMEDKGLEKGVARGLANVFSAAGGGPVWSRKNTRAVQTDAILAQIYAKDHVGPVASHHLDTPQRSADPIGPK
jgi:hypothetical protein